MADIQNLTEEWQGHSGAEVQRFLKQQLVNNLNQFEGKVGYVDYDGTKITFWDDAQKGNKIGEVTLSGDIYKVTLTTDPADTTFNVLSSATSKLLTFSASTQVSSISGGEWEDVNEGHTYSIGVDNGSGSFREVTSGTLSVGATGSYNIRGDLVTGQNRLRLIVTGLESHQQTTKLFIVNVTTLVLECNFSWYKAWVEGSAFNIDRIKFAGNLLKTLYLSLDGDTSNPIRTLQFNSGTNYENYAIQLTDADIPEDWDESGIHTIQLWMVASGVSTEVYNYNIMYVKGSEANTAKLICINETLPAVSNYVSQRLFSFSLYGATSVSYEKVVTDGVNTSTQSDTLSGLITQTKNAFNNLTEFETQSDEGTVTFTLTADTAEEEVEFPLDNSTAYLPTSGALFYMNAANRTNNAVDRLKLLNQAQNASVESYDGVWTGFSFGTTDGWVSESADQPTVLAAKAGCRVKFPDLELMRSLRDQETSGITIEFKFKSDRVADFDSPVLTLGCPYEPTEVTEPYGNPRNGGYYEIDDPTGMSPAADGLYVLDGTDYVLSDDVTPQSGTTYFRRHFGYWERNTVSAGVYSYVPSFDTEVDEEKTYYEARLDEKFNPIMAGIFIYPNKLTVLSSVDTDRVLQSVGLQEGVVHHICIVFNKEYRQSEGGSLSGRSLCSIYVNGTNNIDFAFSGNSNFGAGALTVGQDSTDFSLYMMRYYYSPLSSDQVLTNFINTIIDGVEFTRAGVKGANYILDGDRVSYSYAKQAGYSCMVLETDEALPDPTHRTDRNGVKLRMEYGEGDPRNFTVTNCRLTGQGTTSMQYYRWNLRFRPQSNSVWNYPNDQTNPSATGKKGWFDGKQAHLQVSDIVAKKNYASAMQGHKMGAVSMYHDLYEEMVGLAGLPVGARVSVYQYPALGFRKVSGDDNNDSLYYYIGLYTIGPHKGDKGTFGYDAETYPSLMSIEGPNHAPLGTRFLHAWQNVDYDSTKDIETLEFGGEEAWDDNFVGGYDSDTSDETERQAILRLYETEWRPAYDIVFFCSPYLRSLSEMPTAYNTIANINADVTNFRTGTTDGLRNNLMQVYDSNYDLYAYNNASQAFVKVTTVNESYDGTVSSFSMLSYLKDYLPLVDGMSDASHPTREQLVEARRLKFKAEASTYWNINSYKYHYAFCILIGAKDNFAKNMYPFKFAPLASGGKWEFRQDDLDSIFDTDNNGQQTVKYSVLPGDRNQRGVLIYQGGDSALYALIETAFGDEMNAFMYSLLSKCQNVASAKGITGDTTHDLLYNLFDYYFWRHSAKYFPQEAYNHDTVWSYLTPWYINPQSEYNNVRPLTQARGDCQYSEREWVRKHIAFLFSRYMLGGFTGGSQEYGQMAFTPASGYDLHVVPAIDLYPVTNIGGGAGMNTQWARTEAGKSCLVQVGYGSDAMTTMYILGVDWLSYLGDMCGLVLDPRSGAENINLTFNGKRLRKIKIGDGDPTKVLSNIHTVGVTNNTTSLEEFDARNTTALRTPVDLSACKRIRKVLFAGSGCLSVILPEGAQLEEVSMPDSCLTLQLRSLPNLTFEMLQLSAAAIASVENLYIYNCPLLDPIALLTTLWKSGGSIQYITITWLEEYECQNDAFDALYYIAQNKAYVSGSGTEQDPYVVEDREFGRLVYSEGSVTQINATPIIEGVVNVNGYVNADQWEMLHYTWPNLTINCTGRIIQFEDEEQERICVSTWGDVLDDNDQPIAMTAEKANTITSLGTVFKNNTTIKILDLSYFGKIPFTNETTYNNSLLGLVLNKMIFPANTNNTPRQMFKRSSGTPQAIGTCLLTLFPDGLTTIRNLLSNGAVMGTIVFPSTFTTMTNQDNAAMLHATTGNVYIICKAVTPPTLGNAIQNLSSPVKGIYVPDESVAAYKAANRWSALASLIKGLSEYSGTVPSYPLRTLL